MEIDTRNKNFVPNTLIACSNDAKYYFLHLLYYYVIVIYEVENFAQIKLQSLIDGFSNICIGYIQKPYFT